VSLRVFGSHLALYMEKEDMWFMLGARMKKQMGICANKIIL
jgi:hypothetical protein